MSKITRRVFLGALAGLGLGGAAITSQTYSFGVVRHRASLAGLKNPLRVVQLSDLHFGPFIKTGSVRAWVEATRQENPDLVVITGDLLDSASRRVITDGLKRALSQDSVLLVEELSRLKAPLGVFACWGNHDYGRPSEMRLFEGALEEIGIRVLTNQGLAVRPDLYLAGVDDLWWGQPDARRALADQPLGTASILLCHNPDYLYQVPETAGLTLCGHTHGGQVRLPGVGAPWIPSEFGERFAQGWLEEPVPAYVSRGLGVSGLPIRVACPAELTVFDLNPA